MFYCWKFRHKDKPFLLNMQINHNKLALLNNIMYICGAKQPNFYNSKYEKFEAQETAAYVPAVTWKYSRITGHIILLFFVLQR